MQFEILNMHKKYKQEYALIDDQIYSIKQAQKLFGERLDEILSNNSFVKQNELKKVFKYPKNKKMLEQIEIAKNDLFEKLEISKTTNVYENYKIANKLIVYFIKKLNVDMSIIEDRLFDFKNFSENVQKVKEQLTKVYENKTYDKDKEYRKNKSLFKKVEKETNAQNIKMLFNALVRGKTSNAEDAHTFFYLLKELNIDAYKASIINKLDGTNKILVLVPVKFKKDQKAKYYFYDITEFRQKLKHFDVKKDKENKFTISVFGKMDMLSAYKNHFITSFENEKKAHFENEVEFAKILRQIAKDSLQINYMVN